jgi:hypothetical protein
VKTRALVGIVALSAVMAGCAVVPAEPVPVSAGVYVGTPAPVVVARPAVVYPAYGYGYYGYGPRHYRRW